MREIDGKTPSGGMRLFWRLMVPTALATALVVSAGCLADSSTARITGAWMSADEAGSQPVSSYSPDAVFYAQVDVRGPEETTVKVAWIAVDADDTDPSAVLDEAETAAGTGRALFSLANQGLWPAGRYRIDIYLDGAPERSLEFSVE